MLLYKVIRKIAKKIILHNCKKYVLSNFYKIRCYCISLAEILLATYAHLTRLVSFIFCINRLQKEKKNTQKKGENFKEQNWNSFRQKKQKSIRLIFRHMYQGKLV